MKVIQNQTFDKERAFYGSKELYVKNCKFDGPADGESAFKECREIEVDHSFMNLRYPFWHDRGVTIRNCELTQLCRAALWYSEDVVIEDSKLHGIVKMLHLKTDLAFERSDVEAVITTPVISIKNPLSGLIQVPAVDEIIRDDPNSKGEIQITPRKENQCA